MKITAVEITDYKRVRNVTITPAADRAVILIGGRNGAGKSSTLDALTAAFGGAKSLPDDPVRHGADAATIRIELDGGALTVHRTIASNGATVLEVRDQLGAVRAPQAALDKLIGARFLDPLAFLLLSPKDQRAALMRVIPDAERITTLDGKRARAFDRRTEVGRELSRAEGELARLPEVEVGTAIDVGALTEESRQLAAQQRAVQDLEADLRQHQRETAAGERSLDRARQEAQRIEEEIARLQGQLAEVRAEADDRARNIESRAAAEQQLQRQVHDAAAAQLADQPRRDRVDADLRRADAHNRAVYAAEAQQRRHSEVGAEVAKLGKERAELTALLETIDRRKAEILAAAHLPVDGLAITEDGIELGGVPLGQGSDAERWRVALAIAIAASPGLSDVWIRDGALLDDESLALVAEQAGAAGKRVWIERVGERDPGVIVIQDGRVRA